MVAPSVFVFAVCTLLFHDVICLSDNRVIGDSKGRGLMKQLKARWWVALLVLVIGASQAFAQATSTPEERTHCELN
jgi:hypothetical protein